MSKKNYFYDLASINTHHAIGTTDIKKQIDCRLIKLKKSEIQSFHVLTNIY